MAQPGCSATEEGVIKAVLRMSILVRWKERRGVEAQEEMLREVQVVWEPLGWARRGSDWEGVEWISVGGDDPT